MRTVQKFLSNNGFEHRQWSGYISNKPLYEQEIQKLICKMNDYFPWLKHCINHLDVTDIGEQFDMTYIFNDKNAAPLRTSQNIQTVAKNHSENIAPLSRAAIKQNAEKISQRRNAKEISKIRKDKKQER